MSKRENGDFGRSAWLARGGFDITPHDTDMLASPAYGIYVGVSGNIAVTHEDGSEVVYTGVAGGMWFPVVAIRVKATGTTATGLKGAKAT